MIELLQHLTPDKANACDKKFVGSNQASLYNIRYIFIGETFSKFSSAVDTIVVGILHDVVDDTCQSLQDIEAEFGDGVVKLVVTPRAPS
ncbi:hypothetical protein Fmac_020420 [Flemingia macrophylla]|uniref:HD domain-containing protein n=1 Tax=Flemingia macrophylla TaxID=520843 RepID=A0ABD1LU15_9FABA